MNLDEKRKKFLELIEKIEPKVDYYTEKLHYINNQKDLFLNKFLKLCILRFRILREKSLIKASAIILYKLFRIKIIKKVQLFYGDSIEVFLYDNLASPLYFFSILYEDEIKIAKFLIKNLKENSVFYDIGANYGFYTYLAKEFITSGEIHSFEPLPQIFELLSKNSSNNKSIYLNQIALNNYDGQVQFYDTSIDFYSGQSSLIKPARSSNIIFVNCLRLDSYVQNRKPPTIMKIDVEGAEFLVLEGGKETLKKYQPIIIMEFGIDEYHLKHHLKAVNLLFELGYKMYSLTKDGDLNLVDEKEFNDVLMGVKKPEANYVFKK